MPGGVKAKRIPPTPKKTETVLGLCEFSQLPVRAGPASSLNSAVQMETATADRATRRNNNQGLPSLVGLPSV